MSESDLGQMYGPVEQGRSPVKGPMALMGALTSIAMIAGLGIWGYQLLARDAAGVPVVRALEGPMRVEPRDPGGNQMAHQGLSVNRVAAEGSAGGIAERLRLAPPAADLRPQDLPVGRALAATATDDMVALDKVDEAVDADLINEALKGALDAVAQNGANAPVATEEFLDASVPGVARSAFPLPRPIRAAVKSAPAEGTELAAADPALTDEDIEISADLLPIGARLVQVGAFESADQARREWATIADRYADLMEDRKRVIQEATAGGKTFFRLRIAGFDDLGDARRFCTTLVADRRLCVPVAVR